MTFVFTLRLLRVFRYFFLLTLLKSLNCWVQALCPHRPFVEKFNRNKQPFIIYTVKLTMKTELEIRIVPQDNASVLKY